MSAFDVTLPLPPSVNALYFNAPRKGRIKTQAYQDWIDGAYPALKVAVPLSRSVKGRYGVEIVVPRAMAGDIDNRAKPLLDALVATARTPDDRNLWRLTIERGDVPEGLCRVAVASL